jgi:hypothetical protein
MESQRWLCKELNAYDLMPERNLIQFFITSPKSPDVTSQYKTFVSSKLKTKKYFLSKYDPVTIKQRHFIRSERPRYTKTIPEAVHITTPTPTQGKNKHKKTNPAELVIEDLIRNRQEISLPHIDKPSTPYSNIKQKFIKTKSKFYNHKDYKCETLLQNIKENINNYNLDKELTYRDKQPIRIWNSRPNRIITQKKILNGQKSKKTPDLNKSLDLKKKVNLIEEILETVSDEIQSWKT